MHGYNAKKIEQEYTDELKKELVEDLHQVLRVSEIIVIRRGKPSVIPYVFA